MSVSHETPASGSLRPQPMIEVKGLVKTYGQKRAVDRVSL